MGTIEVAAVPVYTRKLYATLCTLKGDYLQRRSDPRLLGLSIKLASCAVILYVVAVHGKLPGTRDFEYRPCHSLQLERNAGGGHRQCVPPP